MPSTSQPLDLNRRFIWLHARLTGDAGRERSVRMVLDTGTPHTIISTRIATMIGLPQRKAVGVARFEDGVGNVLLGYTARLSSFTALGRTLHDYKVGCHEFLNKQDVVALIGLDFFLQTNLQLAFLDHAVNLDW